MRSARLRTALLRTQYRMHPVLAEWPSAFVYGGRVRNGIGAAARPLPAGLKWPAAARRPAAPPSARGDDGAAGIGDAAEERGGAAACDATPALAPLAFVQVLPRHSVLEPQKGTNHATWYLSLRTVTCMVASRDVLEWSGARAVFA